MITIQELLLQLSISQEKYLHNAAPQHLRSNKKNIYNMRKQVINKVVTGNLITQVRLARVSHRSASLWDAWISISVAIHDKIADWLSFENHRVHLENLRRQHGRKRSFWSRYAM